MHDRHGFGRGCCPSAAGVAQDYQDGVFTYVTDVVQRIGGQLPQSLADFVRAHDREFH